MVLSVEKGLSLVAKLADTEATTAVRKDDDTISLFYSKDMKGILQ